MKELTKREPRKKSLLVYYDVALDLLADLDDKDLGAYFRAIVLYDLYGETVLPEDKYVQRMVKYTKRTLDRDLEQYRAICKRNKTNRNVGNPKYSGDIDQRIEESHRMYLEEKKRFPKDSYVYTEEEDYEGEDYDDEDYDDE